MTKVDGEGLLLHHGSNLNTLSLKSKKKSTFILIFNSSGAKIGLIGTKRLDPFEGVGEKQKGLERHL
jgi:hypothetical protein